MAQMLKYKMQFFIGIALCLLGLVTNCCASSENETTTTPPTTTVRPAITTTTTMSPEFVCQFYNGSCEECVKKPNCYYCYSTSQCLYYPFSHGFPSPQDCTMGELRWAVCWFNFKALIISLSVMAGVVIVSVSVCLYCCCRKKKRVNLKKYAQEDIKREREREERRIKAQERKNERQNRNDEIRRKYGLMKDDKTSYQRFEA